jgi:signal transduction histidine kinase/putative methionine-R-sulfoxide reductase with GAF domain
VQPPHPRGGIVTHAFVDVASVVLFAGIVALLLRQYYQMRRAFDRDLQRLERQNEIGRVLLTDRNVRGVTRHVAESAARLLAGDLGHITLVVEDTGRLVLEAATGPLSALVGAAVPLEGSMAGWVVRHAQPVIVNDADDKNAFRPLSEAIPVRRSVMLPMIARGRCVGALGVDNPKDGRPFGPRDIALLRDLADYAALTIEAIQAIEELGERERHSALLNRINSRIRTSLELQQILDTAVRELGSALGASRCYVRLRRGLELSRPAAEWTGPDVAPLGIGPDPASALLDTAFQERRTVETSDARGSAAALGGAPIAAALGGAPIKEALAVLAAPIMLRGEVAGVLAFHQIGLPRLWRAGDIGLVEETAGELAIAISNARLYRSVEDASRELATKISELERANRMKAQFLANMSHELRTPLNSVIGFSEILLASGRGQLTPDQFDALETIARNGHHLLDLVNDVLDLSKVDAGRMELRLAPLDLKALIASVLEEMESLVRARGHVVQTDLAKDQLVAVADAGRARQVLVNLLSNAVKFTSPGGAITVRASRRRSPLPANGRSLQERDAVRVEVTDSGIGIAAADVPRLFSEFTQVDSSFARSFEGTGLGLALCKRFMDLHGGRIGVDSAKGRGSTFWVEFPVEGPAGVSP